MSAGLASVTTRDTSPERQARPRRARSSPGRACARRASGTAMPVCSTSTSRNRCSSRFGSLRSTASSASRATSRPVSAASVAVPPKSPASRTSAGPSAIVEARARLDRVRRRVVREAVRVDPRPVRLGPRAGPRRSAGTVAPVPSAMCVRPGEPRLAGEQPADELARPRRRGPASSVSTTSRSSVSSSPFSSDGVHGVVDERPGARAGRRAAAEEPELAQRPGRLAGADRDVRVQTARRRVVRERLARHEPDAMDLGGEPRCGPCPAPAASRPTRDRPTPTARNATPCERLQSSDPIRSSADQSTRFGRHGALDRRAAGPGEAIAEGAADRAR